MNYLPSDFVKRAAAGVTSTVSSTVSSVAQVASGKKRHDSVGGKSGEDSLLYGAKEKATLIVKSSPSKDAATTSNLAVKSGFLLKRNEQGNWQKRFVCVVPHTFLYYFDSELGDAPRGIIDLELYTHVNRDDGILKLESGDEDYLRSFYFDDDDKDNLNDWTTSLIRDRYHAVCDERDAYQQMQFEMTGAIDSASSLQKMSEKERNQLEQQLLRSDQLYLGARNALQSVLVELGITDDEMSNLTDIEKIGDTVKQRVNDLRYNYEKQIEMLHDEILSEKQNRESSMEDLTKKIENEHVARKNLEVLVLKERKDAEKRIKESEAQIDNITMNFQMAVASKSTSEAKNNTLNDQKKVLVKEVKQLRKKLDDANVSIDELKAVNDKLVIATNSLQHQLKTALASLEAHHQQLPQAQGDAVEDGPPENTTEGSTTSDNVTAESVEELLKQSNICTASVRSHQEEEKSRSATPNPRTPEAEDQQIRKERQMSINSVDDSADERMSWDMPATSLRELGWLTAEQNKMVEKRIGDSHSRSASPSHGHKDHADDAHGRRGSTLSMFSSVLSGGIASTTGGNSSTEHNDQQANGGGGANRRSSLQMISSMFSTTSRQNTPSEKKEEKDHTQHSTDDTHKAPDGSRLFFSSPFSNHFDDDESNPERLPKAMRLQCLRCKGTVEGPKFSTCKCVIPALSPDDLNNTHNGGTLNMLSGLAGGFAGGLMKATAATASSVSGLVHYSTHSPAATSHSMDSKPTMSTHGEEPLLDLSEDMPYVPPGRQEEVPRSEVVVDSSIPEVAAEDDSDNQTSL